MKKTGLAAVAILFMLASAVTVTGCQKKGETASGAGAPAQVIFTGTKAAYEPIDIPAFLAAPSTDNLQGVVMAGWRAAEGAVSYQVFVAKATKFSNTANPNSRSSSNGIYDTAAGDVVPGGSSALPPDRPAEPVLDNTTATSYFHIGADPGGVYYFWVRSKNDAGYGDATMTSVWLNPVKDLPNSGGDLWKDGRIERGDYPRNVKTIANETSVTISWAQADRSVWYELYYSTSDIPAEERSGESWSEDRNGNADRLVPYKRIPLIQDAATPWDHENGRAGTVGTVYKIHSLETTVTGLTKGTPYYFWIRSLNSNGERGFTKVTVTPDTPLKAPANVKAAVNTAAATTLEVSWDAVPGASGYRVYFSTYSNTPALTALSYPASGTTFSMARLNPNTAYYVWVVAEDGSKPGVFSARASAKTGAASTASPKLAKRTVNGDPMTNILYFEINEGDPRAALGYLLDDADKTQYFDAVILFAANLRVRDCAAEKARGEMSHDCYKKGPHIHFNGNVAHVLENRDKYIKPLQDAGIKVLLGTLPDHDHFTYSSFFKWPFESVYAWDNQPSLPNQNDNPGYTFHAAKWYTGNPDTYPFAALNEQGKSYTEVFIDDLVDVINRYGLDGFDIDDEYGSSPWSEGGNTTRGLTTDAAQYGSVSFGKDAPAFVKQITENLANFMLIARQKLDATTAAGAPRKWITVYEYGIGDNYLGVPGVTMSDGQDVAATFVNHIDWAYEGIYNNMVAVSSNGFPKEIYGPFSINIWRADPSARTASDITTINTRMNSILSGGNQVMMYFAPTSLQNLPNIAGYGNLGTENGVTRTQAQYLSLFSRTIFGFDVIYEGPDYPIDWARR